MTAAAEITAGVAVWHRGRGHEVDGDGRVGDPVGGVVVDYYDVTDRETGETLRVFVCVDGDRSLRWTTVPESEVDGDRIEFVERHRFTRLVRRLAEEFVYSDPSRLQRRTGRFTPYEIRCHQAMHNLIHAAVAPGGHLHGLTRRPLPQTPSAPRPIAPPNVAALVD